MRDGYIHPSMIPAKPSKNSDPLGDVFSLVEVENLRCTRLEADGRWALHFPAKPLLKFVAVVRGECWVILAGQEPRPVRAGDVFLLIDPPGYVVASEIDASPIDGSPLFHDSDVARLGGDATILLGGGFTAAADDAGLLLDVLPDFLLIPAADPAAEMLRATVAMMDGELRRSEMGADVVVQRLADILVMQALRAHAATQDGDDLGWVGALGDRHIGLALRLIHRDPGRDWTVASLAAESGLSRSGFALRFKQKVKRSPLEYLRWWRMQRARILLKRGDIQVAGIAERLGYESESAFRTAFRRTFGRSPKRYSTPARTYAGDDGADACSRSA